ncbi:MAG: DUF362 domain-containing protein [Candidatus Lokiarchaeota archaeon]|nr:DUF362 domain-containing protein [Candidatus Lokiarchaeota archaeon]
MKKIILDNDRFQVYRQDGKLLGFEKKHVVYTGQEEVFIQEIKPDIIQSMKNGFNRINAETVFEKGDYAAIKINLGGGIHGVLSSYTDPDLVKELVIKLREIGVVPFICEADMRGHEINQELLRARGYLDFLIDMKIPFLNLSKIKQVLFKFRGIKKRISIPFALLKPNVKIISFPCPKHHWECGITVSQKNMYGAIGDYRKSRFHRKYELIDHVVAAAARIMKPDLCIVGTKQVGAGLGPHFCIPINFYRVIFGKDMLSVDKFCSEILGYPIDLVLYQKINAQNNQIDYKILPGSAKISEDVLKKIYENRIPPEEVQKDKGILWAQYFIPSSLQFKYYRYLEGILTWMNHKFYVPKGDKLVF